MKYVYFVRGAAHRKLLQVSIASVFKADPQSSVVVYTDDQDNADPIMEHDLSVRVHRIPAGMPIMLANLEAQCRAMYDAELGETVAFLDTDVLLLKQPNFREIFDLAVTWRDRVLSDEDGNAIEGLAKVMPYNYGVIFARGGFAATEAFLWMRSRIHRMSTQMQDWYGNQIALAALAGPRPSDGYMLDCRRIPWTPTTRGNNVWVQKIPCTEWNYTPQGPAEDVSARGILHFKGKARGLMQGYAEALGIEWPEAEKPEAA